MKELIFIHLPESTNGQVNWHHYTESTGLKSQAIESANLHSALSGHPNARIVALVPDEQCLVTDVSLPTKQRRQQMKALPFVLEENLAMDIDDVHFALGKSKENGKNTALAIERRLMQSYFDWLARHEIKPVAMCPLSALVDGPDDAIVIHEVNETYYVSQMGQNFAASLDDLVLMLELSMSGWDEEALPGILLYTANEEVPAALTGLGLPIEILNVNDALMSLLARFDDSKVSLLQGEFEIQTDWEAGWSLWRKAAIAAALVVVFQFARMGVDVYQLQAEQDYLDAEILATYQSVSPNGRLIPGRTRAQMQQLLDRSTGASQSDAAFLPMLEKLSLGLRGMSGVRTTNLNYDSTRKEMRLDLTVSALPQMDQLKEALSEQGLTVEVGAASQQGSSYAGRLTLRSES